MGVNDDLGKAQLAAGAYMEIGATAVVEPAHYIDAISPLPTGYAPARGTRYRGTRMPDGWIRWYPLPPADDIGAAA